MVSFKALFLSLAVVVPFVVAEGGSVERLGTTSLSELEEAYLLTFLFSIQVNAPSTTTVPTSSVASPRSRAHIFADTANLAAVSDLPISHIMMSQLSILQLSATLRMVNDLMATVAALVWSVEVRLSVTTFSGNASRCLAFVASDGSTTKRRCRAPDGSNN